MNNTAGKQISLYEIVSFPVFLIEKFRLGISIVLAFFFALVLLDEPKSAGDLLLLAIVVHVAGIASFFALDYVARFFLWVADAIAPERK